MVMSVFLAHADALAAAQAAASHMARIAAWRHGAQAIERDARSIAAFHWRALDGIVWC
ncbi:MAG: hypothetical protein ABFD65_13875 [Candidatus Polarisedimenticolia bacterium]